MSRVKITFADHEEVKEEGKKGMTKINIDLRGLRMQILVLEDNDFNRHSRETGNFVPEGISGSFKPFRDADVVIHRGRIMKNRYSSLDGDESFNVEMVSPCLEGAY